MAQAVTIAYAGQRRFSAADLLSVVVARFLRLGFVILGLLVIIAGIVIAPLPGPFGLPIAVVGLMIVLRNSMWAKRRFVAAKRRWPNWVYPFRRLMRREPELGPVAWQQALRTERLLTPKGSRFLRRWRRKQFRRKA